MNASKAARRAVAAALLLAMAWASPVTAKGTAAEPMMDYGVGQFATIEQWRGDVRAVTDDSYVMDYGVGRFPTIAAWMGAGATTTLASAPAVKLLAKR